jgi:hypothetical protein
MSIYQVSCPSRVLLLDEEYAQLAAVPGAGWEPEYSLWCELENGHEGRHAVKGQCAGGPGVPRPYTVWVLWPDEGEFGEGRELTVLPRCPEEFLPGHVEGECCGLYLGHPGRHGFEFGPPLDENDLTPDLLAWLGELPKPDVPEPEE